MEQQNKKYRGSFFIFSAIIFAVISLGILFVWRSEHIFDHGAVVDAVLSSDGGIIDSSTLSNATEGGSAIMHDDPTVSVVSKNTSIKKKPVKEIIPIISADQSSKNITMSTEDSSGIMTPLGDRTIVTSSSPTSTISSTAAEHPSCSFPASSPALSRKIIFNEIAWMGSPSSSKEEWIELKNNSGADIDISNWSILNAGGTIKISFAVGTNLTKGELLLLSRASSTFFNAAIPQQLYSGDLRNAGDALVLVNTSCEVSDFLDNLSSGWVAGNNTTKHTMERNVGDNGWHTSVSSGGTPGKENSLLISAAVSSSVTSTYKLVIAFTGDGAGVVSSMPSGIACPTQCQATFASGTKLTLTASASKDSAFTGWSGSCYGQTLCSFTISSDSYFTAGFHSVLAIVPDSAPVQVINSEDISSSSVVQAATTPHLLIAAVQVAGASSTNDLVKIFNPTSNAVDMGGWKLHKRSSTGTDYSLRTFSAGTTIGAQQYIIWANSVNGFSESVGANVSSTETLSADNSVALFDSSSTVVDAVAWGMGTNQYGEGSAYPSSSGPNQLLQRKNSGGVMADTDNNADDFFIQ